MAGDKALIHWIETACRELSSPFRQIPENELTAFIDTLRAASRVALFGVGREGLMVRAFAMRLYHLGMDAHPVGEMTTPAIASGDCLVVSAGPGHFATVEALMNVAHASGARTALVTANPHSRLRRQADTNVVLPARTMAVDAAQAQALPMGSAFEGALFLFFEHVVAELRKAMNIDEAAMRARHTNLE